MPLSQIEKSVTHLLVATKQLLETLTQWSRGSATDTQVSDVYVRLGYEFNMACRAFTAINVDTSDLGNVPELLRNILEATLSQEASVESLEKYLPRIRDIIINLLHGLKKKQQKLRQKQTRDKENGLPESSNGRITSTSTQGSNTGGLSQMLNEGLSENGYRPASSRGTDDTIKANGSPRRFQSHRDESQAAVSDKSSLSSDTMQSMPVVPPYPSEDPVPTPAAPEELDNFPPPPPPPKSSTQSALAALQRGGDLERRASRRYSAYQISKHLGSGATGVPMMPTQTGPIPNRGRPEVRESMRAVQARETVRRKNNDGSLSARPGALDPSSPQRQPNRASEEREVPKPASPTPEDRFKPSATLKGPLPDVVPTMATSDGEITPKTETKEELQPAEQKPATPTPEEQGKSFGLDQSPPTSPSKDLTLFLQYKSRVKKFVLAGGYGELTIGRLQLAFIEKFSWNTHANGADLPEIYIQDPVSGVRHELEDLADIKDRSVLVLNVEALDEVKKHVDDGLGSIRQLIETVKQDVGDQSAALQRVSDRQQESAKEIARLAAAPPTPPSDSPRSTLGTGRKLKGGQAGEVQTLRRDLAVLRQMYTNFQSEVDGSMTLLRNKANNVKAAAAKASLPDTDGGSGQQYVKKGRKQLNTDSDRLVNKVDDLQDLVEDLRKDVVQRGVRPLPRQLETVAKDMQNALKELKKMEEYMKREKPVWTKIWEKELEDVCNGRDEVKLMEDLVADLQDDLEKASETFALVEQATKEQMKDVNAGQTNATVSRQFSRGLKHIEENTLVDPSEAKEGVLGEVRALQPNHENRMEAIERAEKLRQKELATRNQNPIKKELVEFVSEGKLKKSGGVEELERQRVAREERIRKEVWERMNGLGADDATGEGEIPEGEEEYEYEEVEEEVEVDEDGNELEKDVDPAAEPEADAKPAA